MILGSPVDARSSTVVAAAANSKPLHASKPAALAAAVTPRRTPLHPLRRPRPRGGSRGGPRCRCHRPPSPRGRGTPAPASCRLRARGGDGAAPRREPLRRRLGQVVLHAGHRHQRRGRHGETSSAAGYQRRGELEELGAAGPLHLRRPQAFSADDLYPIQETTSVLRRSASRTDGSSRWGPASTKYRRRPASTSRRRSRRLPALARIEQKKLAASTRIEEKKLEIEERRLTWEQEQKIMFCDLSSMDERQRVYVRAMRAQIAAAKVVL
ncbi:uncharacterized protein LOC120654519 [Panicum virgatum]|uniref:uncharacterized protein LOC120654519 n=1 Tax=Panicum virgatum TaxID=38727 RepID=UPI0019D5A859|nr:uncharacterized protein LOC120654519 [Panicum virgatum]